MKFGNYSHLRGFFDGHTVNCVGSGPSINEIDKSVIMQSRKIVMNSSLLFYEPTDSDIIVAIDNIMLSVIGIYIADRFCCSVYDSPIKIVVSSKLGLQARGSVSVVPFQDKKIKWKPGYFRGSHSGEFALNVALFCGAKSINLLGYDCSSNGGMHFYDDYWKGINNKSIYSGMGRHYRQYSHLNNVRVIGLDSKAQNMIKISTEDFNNGK